MIFSLKILLYFFQPLIKRRLSKPDLLHKLNRCDLIVLPLAIQIVPKFGVNSIWETLSFCLSNKNQRSWNNGKDSSKHRKPVLRRMA